MFKSLQMSVAMFSPELSLFVEFLPDKNADDERGRDPEQVYDHDPEHDDDQILG